MLNFGSSKKKVVILGGGFGGLNTSILLEKISYTPLIDLDITLIDNKDSFIFYPFLYETLSDELNIDDISIDYKNCPDLKGVDYKKATVKSINLFDRRIETDISGLDYDILVISLGSKTRIPSILGEKPNVFIFKNPIDVEKLKHQISYQIKRFHNLKDKVEINTGTNKEELESLLTFLIVGAGPSGVELSTKLSDIMKTKCKDEGIDPSLSKIVLIDVNEKLLPNFSNSTSRATNKILKQKGIELHLGTTIHKLEDNIATLIGKDRINLHCGTIVWTGGTEFNPVIPYLGMDTTPDGKILTDEYLQSLHALGVFAIGDNAEIEKNKILLPLPQTAQVAIQQSYICSYNILAHIIKLPKIPYNYLKVGEMLSLGKDSGYVDILGNKFEGKTAKWIRKMLYSFAFPGENSINKMIRKIMNKAKKDKAIPEWF